VSVGARRGEGTPGAGVASEVVAGTRMRGTIRVSTFCSTSGLSSRSTCSQARNAWQEMQKTVPTGLTSPHLSQTYSAIWVRVFHGSPRHLGLHLRGLRPLPHCAGVVNSEREALYALA
jgi:hypothetical protein